jgi:DNA-binding MarR family transcriptional regulator
MEDLTRRQIEFLNSLKSHQRLEMSARELGREYFNTDRSIYLVLDRLCRNGFIEVEKGKKHLRIIVTKKGLNFLDKNYAVLKIPQGI